MNYLLHGATLTLAWFLAINLASSLLVVCLARAATHGGSSSFWFSMRLLPAVTATAFTLAVFVPSYWRYEPRDTTEGFDVTLTTAAIVGGALLAAAAARGMRAWWRARRRTALWLRTARPFALPGAHLPAFAVDVDAPLIALAGILRPRLLITRGLVDALTGEELSASIAHELAHRRTWDNLKRLLMCAAPDVLAFTALARALERRWAAAAEQVADRMCGDLRPSARCALASALVKVARLTPPPPAHTEPISTLITGDDIASRVECLLNDAPPPTPGSSAPRYACAVALAAAALAVAYGPILESVHDATEVLVRWLP